jgi:uncharacterized membrane protein YgdD (TMEM256/DUF423 family)
MKNILVVLMGLSGLLGNGLGAYGAHVLKHRLDEKMLTIFQTGVTYQFYHTLAMGLVLIAYMIKPKSSLLVAGFGFFVGICFFSGSLYTLAMTHIKWVGPLTPIGGLFFMLSWLLFMVALLGDE